MHPLIVIPLNPKESNRPLIDLTSVVPNYDVLYSTVRGLIITRSSLTEQLALSSLQLAAVYSVISSPGCNFLFFAYKRYFFQLYSGRISFSVYLQGYYVVYIFVMYHFLQMGIRILLSYLKNPPSQSSTAKNTETKNSSFYCTNFFICSILPAGILVIQPIKNIKK